MRSTQEKRLARLEEKKRAQTGGGYTVDPPLMPEQFLSEKENKKRINKNLDAMAPGSKYIAICFGEWVKDLNGRLRKVFAFDRDTFLKLRNEAIKKHDEIKDVKVQETIKKIKKAQPIKPQVIQEPRKKEDSEDARIEKVRRNIQRDFGR